MTIADILRSQGERDEHSLFPLADVKTEEDIKFLIEAGYLGFETGFTKSEWEDRFRIPAEHVYYDRSPFGSMVYYDPNNIVPIYVNLSVYGKEVLTHGTEEDWQNSILQVIDELQNNPSQEQIMSYLALLDDSVRIMALNQYIQNQDVEASTELYSWFLELYVSTNYGFGRLDLDALKKVVNGKSDDQKAATKERLSEFPDVVDVYRGQGSASTPYTDTFSWTSDINVANFFACRLSLDDAVIIHGKVKKEDIIECIEGDESELWILPESLMDVEEIHLIGPDDDRVVEFKYSTEYQMSRKTIADIYGANLDSAHGAHHTLRVLFLALYLVQLEDIELTDYELCSLCNTCIWHDVGRVNDETDDSHGKRSMKKFKETSDDKIAAFAIKYHCISDDVAYAELGKNKKMTATQRRSAWKILKILKDADALDRVRFGIRELDMNYLRHETAKLMTPIALGARVLKV